MARYSALYSKLARQPVWLSLCLRRLCLYSNLYCREHCVTLNDTLPLSSDRVFVVLRTMVKLFHLCVMYKAPEGAPARCLRSASDVSSFGFFHRSSVAEFLRFTSKVLVERSQRASRSSVKEQQYVCHVYIRADQLAAVLVSDEEYPQRVAHSLLGRVLDEFVESVAVAQWATCNENQAPYDKLEHYLAAYQNPKADAMTRIQEDLHDTKIILYNTINSILERGEKLDSLVAKSEDLSAQSKVFFQTAKKTNQCCKLY